MQTAQKSTKFMIQTGLRVLWLNQDPTDLISHHKTQKWDINTILANNFSIGKKKTFFSNNKTILICNDD